MIQETKLCSTQFTHTKTAVCDSGNKPVPLHEHTKKKKGQLSVFGSLSWLSAVDCNKIDYQKSKNQKRLKEEVEELLLYS